MKVSEFLKKIGCINKDTIKIVFKKDKFDTEPDIEYLDGDTTEETADRIIERSAEYTLQEVNFDNNVVFATAIRTAKRTPKPEKKQEEKREEQKRAIAEELERLDQAVAVLIETIVAPFRRPGRRENGKRGGILETLKNARAAVRRILKRMFRKGGEIH